MTAAARLESLIAWNDGKLPSKGGWKALAGDIGPSPEALYRELSKRHNSYVQDRT
jgi:hypothetical protein